MPGMRLDVLLVAAHKRGLAATGQYIPSSSGPESQPGLWDLTAWNDAPLLRGVACATSVIYGLQEFGLASERRGREERVLSQRKWR